MKYLYNIGCSFSIGNGIGEELGYSVSSDPRKKADWPAIKELEAKSRYSAVLSEKLGLKEINEANGGGSNQRIFRKTWNWIAKNPKLLSETLFVIQWTFPLRAEYYRDKVNHLKSKWNHLEYKTIVEDRMHMWYDEPEVVERWKERGLFKSGLDLDPLSEKSASNQTLRYVLSLQSFFKEHKVNFIFFEGADTAIEGTVDLLSDLGKLIDFNHWILESFVSFSGKELTPNGHPNQKMQILWAEKLEKFIKDKNWLS
jgi:hypothetical protein